MSRKVIKEFGGGYGRIGVIWVDNVVCDFCNNKKPCIISDGSEGEYQCAFICPDCATIECKKWVADQSLGSKKNIKKENH